MRSYTALNVGSRNRFHQRYFCLIAIVLLISVGGSLLIEGCGSGSGGSEGTQTAKLSVTTKTLSAGTVGVVYSAALLGSGGSGSGYVWTVSSGTLPSGIVLSSSGGLSGTPTATGNSTFSVKVVDSAGNSATESLTLSIAAATPLTTYEFTGDTSPVHDPSIIRQGSTYYVFSTDGGIQSGYIPIRCSTDKIAWSACGYVFSAMPSWVASTVPAATNIWAPDISYFNGTYHLYYAVSTFGSQVSAIGLATTPTMDQTNAAYKWTDQGAILTSTTGANYNAIDPNILADTDGSVWLTYGSYWSGIFQQQIDPATGKILPGMVYYLAERASSVPGDPVEGSSLVHKGSYYYLFVSWDACCNTDPATDNYKIVVGRGTSPHGPFLDESGADMLAGGGTILLQGDGMNWSAPGGQTAYLDATGGDLIVFHALRVTANYGDYLFVRTLSFDTGWPVIGNSTVQGP